MEEGAGQRSAGLMSPQVTGRGWGGGWGGALHGHSEASTLVPFLSRGSQSDVGGRPRKDTSDNNKPYLWSGDSIRKVLRTAPGHSTCYISISGYYYLEFSPYYVIRALCI